MFHVVIIVRGVRVPSALSVPYPVCVTLHNVPAETLYNNANARKCQRNVSALLQKGVLYMKGGQLFRRLSDPDFTLIL